MKRKFADRRGWKRILKKEFNLIPMMGEIFEGYLSVYKILEVTEPLYVNVCGNDKCAVDKGYIWLQLFDGNSPYVMTAVFDQLGNIVEWYFDICKQQGVGRDGIPYLDDLFLDVVVSADHKWELIDQKELDEALKDGIINKQEYDFAESAAVSLIDRITGGMMPLMAASIEFYKIYVG